MRLKNLTIAALALAAMACGPRVPEVEEGVSRELAVYRSALVSDLGYRVEFRIPEDRDGRIGGRETITFTLKRKAPLQLDFRPDGQSVPRLTVNGKQTDADCRSEHIVLDRRDLKKGPQHPRTGLSLRRPVPQPQRGIPLHPLRPRPGADRIPLLRPTGSQRPLFPDPGPPRRMGSRRQRRRTGPGRIPDADPRTFPGNPAPEHLSIRLHRREMAQGDAPARGCPRERVFPRNGPCQDRPAR